MTTGLPDWKESLMDSIFILLFLVLYTTEGSIIKNNNIYIFRKGSLESQWAENISKDISNNPGSTARNQDTLFIDDGEIGGYYFSPQDGYYAMRFSPGTICTLKSVLVTTYNTGPTCSVLVWDNSPFNLPGTLLTVPTPFISIYDPVWQRVDLLSPVIVSSDFWIGIFAHCPPYPAIDNYPDYIREADSANGWHWHLLPVDYRELMIRGIGNLGGTRRDVSTEKIFLSSGPLLPNPSTVEVSCLVRNYGNKNEINIPLSLNVYDSTGTIIFRDSTLIPYLEHLDEDTITFLSQWHCNLNGHYIISTQTNVENDCMKDNDTTLAEVFVLTYPALFYYDDGEPDINCFDSTAVKFTPPYYPCSIESVAFYVAANEESTSNYFVIARVLDDDGIDNFPLTEIAKDSIHGIHNGWNIIDFSQENTVIDAGSFYVQYIEKPKTYYMDLCSDMTPPFVMLQWEYYQGTWYYCDDYQDPMMRIYADYSNSVYERDFEINNDIEFFISPNPSYGFVEINLPLANTETEISIFSINGREILTFNVTKNKEKFFCDLRNLTSGVYFVRLSTKNCKKIKKLILIK